MGRRRVAATIHVQGDLSRFRTQLFQASRSPFFCEGFCGQSGYAGGRSRHPRPLQERSAGNAFFRRIILWVILHGR